MYVFSLGISHDDLHTAIDNLRNGARLRPRVTVVEGAETERLVREALSALRGLSGSIGFCLERVLPSLEPHVSRDAVRAFALEMHRELDDLAACRTVGDVYVETLTITEPGRKAISLEIEGSLGGEAPFSPIESFGIHG